MSYKDDYMLKRTLLFNQGSFNLRATIEEMESMLCAEPDLPDWLVRHSHRFGNRVLEDVSESIEKLQAIQELLEQSRLKQQAFLE